MKRKEKITKIVSIALACLIVLGVFSAGMSAFAANPLAQYTVGTQDEMPIKEDGTTTEENKNEEKTTEKNDAVVSTEVVTENTEETKESDTEEAITGVSNEVNFGSNSATTNFSLDFSNSKLKMKDCKSNSLTIVMTNTATNEVFEAIASKDYDYKTSIILDAGEYTVKIKPDSNYNKIKLDVKTITIDEKTSEYKLQVVKVVEYNRFIEFIKNNSFLLVLLIGSCIGFSVIKRKRENELTESSDR